MFNKRAFNDGPYNIRNMMKTILYIGGVSIFVVLASVAGYFLIPFISVSLEMNTYLWYPALGAIFLLAIIWVMTIRRNKSKVPVLILTPVLLAIAIPFLINAIKFGEKIRVRNGVIQSISSLDDVYSQSITKYYNIFGQKFYEKIFNENSEGEIVWHEYSIRTDEGTKGIVIGSEQEIKTDEIYSVPVINTDGEYVLNKYGENKFEDCKKSEIKYEAKVFDVYGNSLDYIEAEKVIFTGIKSGRQYTVNQDEVYIRDKFVPFHTILSEEFGYTYIPRH